MLLAAVPRPRAARLTDCPQSHHIAGAFSPAAGHRRLPTAAAPLGHRRTAALQHRMGGEREVAPAWHALAAGASSAVASRTFTCGLAGCRWRLAGALPSAAGAAGCLLPSCGLFSRPTAHPRCITSPIHPPAPPADPPDTVKARLQVQGAGGGQVLYRGTIDAFAKIAAREVGLEGGGFVTKRGKQAAAAAFRLRACWRGVQPSGGRVQGPLRPYAAAARGLA